MSFQQVINRELAPAQAGDFASANPRSSVVPPVESGFVAAPAQTLNIGYFAWGAATGLVYSSGAGGGAGSSLGFLARVPNIPSILITAFLAESRLSINDGSPVTLQSSGDYWAFLPGATMSAKVYADVATGAPTLDDNSAANPDTGFTCQSVAPVNCVTAGTTTIAVNTGVMTIATIASGVAEVGQRVTGTGVPVGTFITRQLTGTAGQAGTYQTNSYNRPAVAAFVATLVQGGMVKITKVAA